MKSFLRVIGTLLYSVAASSLVYLFLWWVTPYVMMINGWGLFFLFLFFVESALIGGIVTLGTTLLGALAAYITGGNMAAKIVYIIIFAIAGLWSCVLPFNIDMEYAAVNWAVAITQAINIAIIYISMIFAVFIDFKD